MRETKSPRGRGQEFWREVIQSYEASGERQKIFCSRNGISVFSLKYWRKRLGSATEKPAKPDARAVRLVPVRIRDKKELRTGEHVIEICRDGFVFRVPEGADALYVESLLRRIFADAC